MTNEEYATQLQKAGIKGEKKQLLEVASDFDNDSLTLDLLASYLKRWYAGRLNGLETIPVLLDRNPEGRGLRRVLAAFESKLHGTSDMTLLCLLSLSDRPVAHQHMKAAFHSTLMERWLTKRDDYVRFLGPLGRLNEEHWQWVIENLRRLKLLEAPIDKQHDLLVVSAPIRDYFRNNLKLRSRTVFDQGTADMEKLSKDTVVDFRQRYKNAPEIKTWISPQLQEQLDLEIQPEPKPEEKSVLWKQEELDTAQQQLLALRDSLKSLKSQTEQLTKYLISTDIADKTTDLLTEASQKPV
uniref:Uncharacterized protein n=1 Tax=uncultured Thiotrichaceae bacterium TaxID=298394 RepID=A0A6S6THU1_9GAMM|nr:MAG: Unknown protein [uncultured Thiotrichaceae bacterium]